MAIGALNRSWRGGSVFQRHGPRSAQRGRAETVSVSTPSIGKKYCRAAVSEPQRR